MTSKYIAAWTAPRDCYPPYINISFVDSDTIRVTVREKSKSDSQNASIVVGDTTYIDLPRDVAVSLFTEASGKVSHV